MTEAEIKAMQEENASLKTKVTTLEQTIVDKDAIIEQKTNDVIGARRKYRKLDELSEDEKAGMSEAEIERKKDQDLLFEEQEETRKKQEEERSREITERKNEAVRKFAGDDPELQAKVLANFDKIKGAELAYTQSEIAEFMGSAFNLLGDERPNPVREAGNATGGVAPVIGQGDRQGGGFADSEEGKTLGNALGLASAQEEAK